MGQVTITLNGRAYRMSCGAGEEARLHELARELNQRLERLAIDFGQHGNERLLVMAALLLTDELMELKASASKASKDTAPSIDHGNGAEKAPCEPTPDDQGEGPPPSDSTSNPAAEKTAPRASPHRLSLEARLAEARAGRSNPPGKSDAK